MDRGDELMTLFIIISGLITLVGFMFTISPHRKWMYLTGVVMYLVGLTGLLYSAIH